MLCSQHSTDIDIDIDIYIYRYIYRYIYIDIYTQSITVESILLESIYRVCDMTGQSLKFNKTG